MMRRIIPPSLLVLVLTSGVALAQPDRARGGHGGQWDRGGPVYRGGAHGPIRTYGPSEGYYARGRAGPYDRSYVRPYGGGHARPSYDRGYRGGYARPSYDRGYRGVHVPRTRPVFRDDRFYFSGGYYRPYIRPVIDVRYRDYNHHPTLIVETYDAVPGYVWIQGRWSWNGYEWIWVPGYYDVDPAYQDPYDGYGYPY